MNAGAYGGEIATLLQSVSWMDPQTGAISETIPHDGAFSYRYSAFRAPECMVLSATFSLQPDDGSARMRMAEYTEKRREKQPLSFPSAGSTFKRPEGNFAGALIEQCGLKGMRIGGAQVSTLHAGFLINAGGATSSDVYALMCQVQKVVYENKGVLLEPEVHLLGSFALSTQKKGGGAK